MNIFKNTFYFHLPESFTLSLTHALYSSLCPFFLSTSLFIIMLFFSGTRIISLLGDNCHHVPTPDSAKDLVDMLDFKLLSREEIDDMKVIAKKVKDSGK